MRLPALVVLMAWATAGSAAAQSPVAQGTWGSLSAGVGSMNCETCTARTTGFSAELRVGRALSRSVYVAVATDVWMGSVTTTSSSGSSYGGELAGTVIPIVQIYPNPELRLFLSGGVGFGLAGEPGSLGRVNTGLGTIIGLGYDFPTRGNANISAFLNSVGMRSDRNNMNVLQIGVGITLH